MPYNDDDVKTAVISKNSQALEAIIAAPTGQSRIAIDYLMLNALGGANRVTLTGTIAPIIDLTDNQTLVLDNANHDPKGIIHCSPATAFSLTQDSSNLVSGFVKYRIINL